MNGLEKMLLQEKERLESIIEETEKSLKNAPEGYLRISKDRGKIRYYHCTNDRNGTYISQKEEQLPRKLAQKKYDDDILKLAKCRLKQIAKLHKNYSDNELEQVYQILNPERKALVKPIEPTIEQQEEEWYHQEYTGKEFQEGTLEIFSEKGERVRSKSEKIIADWLYRNGIKYLYEKPIHLKGYGVIYPDFTFWSKKMGREIYWEHEGMMDNPEYARTAVKKLELYEKNDIFPGENLILTFETSMTTLNNELIREIANKYLI